MNPFKTFEVNSGDILIDGKVVMVRPAYVNSGEWVDYWNAASSKVPYWDAYEEGYSDGYESGLNE